MLIKQLRLLFRTDTTTGFQISEVAQHLKSDNNPTNIKVSPKLSDLKPHHASWIVDLYKHTQGEDKLILKGFKEVGIYEAINDAQEIFKREENLFRA